MHVMTCTQAAYCPAAGYAFPFVQHTVGIGDVAKLGYLLCSVPGFTNSALFGAYKLGTINSCMPRRGVSWVLKLAMLQHAPL